jgi:hypothetical protein
VVNQKEFVAGGAKRNASNQTKIEDKLKKLKKKGDLSEEGEAINLLYQVMMRRASKNSKF